MRLFLWVMGGGAALVLLSCASAMWGIHLLERETRGNRPTLW